MKKGEKALSPIIATVLLITMVIIIALIVFLWIRGMTEEAVTKFGDRNIQLVCGEVAFEADYSSGNTLYITNSGNVPIFGINVKVIGDGSHETIDLTEEGGWPNTGLNQGGSFSGTVDFGEAEEIILVPVLIGESESGRKTYVCDENQYGYQLML